jgi:RNA polymerase sigma factor (sigma-70 family)
MKEYYITMKDGTKVPVTEEVYRAYKRPAWREHKRRIVRSEYERSLERFEEDHVPISSNEVLEDIVADKILIETLLSALTPEEKFIINEIYFQGKTEREIAKEMNIAQQSINKKKNRILLKLRNLIK